MKKFISLCLALPALATASEIKVVEEPTGSISAPYSVPSGTKAPIEWEVNSLIDPPDLNDTVIVTKDYDLQVRAIGAGYWSGNKKVRLVMRINETEYEIFAPAKAKYFSNGTVLFDKNYSYTFEKGEKDQSDAQKFRIWEGDVLNFGMKGYSNQSGDYLRWTGTSRNTTGHTMMALRNGDEFPSYTPMGDDGDVESFLQGYLDSETNRVSIGPKDIIYIAELDRLQTFSESNDPADKGYDMQDLVFLVTFSNIEKETQTIPVE